MKKLNLWLLASLFSGLVLITACSHSDDPVPDPVPDNGLSDGTPVNPASMKMSALSGFVYSPEGIPLQNVQVTSGTEACVTGPDGGFVLEKVNSVSGRTVVRLSCGGYFDVVRSMPTASGDVWEITMIPTWGNDKIASVNKRASEEISVNAAGMTVALQAEGLKYADSGESLGYYDWVTAQMLYLSPDDKDFGTMMPGGDLAAVRTDNSQVQLVSYGMSNVTLMANGRKVQPADGKPATVTFPVPEKFRNNTPAEIPLWSFNEQTGLWEEEGVATYDSHENVYRGEVTHFSWVNLDYPEKRATVKVNVKDQAGNVIPNQAIDVDGQRTYYTNVNGVAEFFVPINTDFYVTVRSRDYSYYSPEVKVNVEKLTSAGATKTVDIVLPVMAHISGKVVNSGKGNNLSSLWIEYGNNKATKAVHTDADGQFIINAPFDYKGAAKLVLLASDGSTKRFDITLDGKDHAYTVSIKTDKATGGIINYSPNGGTARSVVISPMFVSDFEGVEIVDDKLSLSAGSVYMLINGYSDSKSTYSDANFSVYASDVSLHDEAGKVTLTKNEYNNYTFKVSGNSSSTYWNGNQYVSETGSYNGEFTAPMLGKGKTIKPVTKKESFFPSFTPWLDGKKATIGLQITESSVFGTGVLLWYFDNSLGYDDYKSLKAQAQKALGDPVESFDAADSDICVSYFYKEGKYIMVSFCPWREVDAEEEDFYTTMGLTCLRENHAARIQVHVLENMQVTPDDIIVEHWN